MSLNSKSEIVGLILFVLFLPIILPMLFVYILFGLFLHIVIWLVWCTQGKNVLFVYSNSPVWQDYVEQQILPRLSHNAIILNWSERKNWHRFSLAAMAFDFFGGDREFNPLAVVFRPLRFSRTFRFWNAFKFYKHGKAEPLTKMEQDMFGCLGLSDRAKDGP